MSAYERAVSQTMDSLPTNLILTVRDITDDYDSGIYFLDRFSSRSSDVLYTPHTTTIKWQCQSA